MAAPLLSNVIGSGIFKDCGAQRAAAIRPHGQVVAVGRPPVFQYGFAVGSSRKLELGETDGDVGRSHGDGAGCAGNSTGGGNIGSENLGGSNSNEALRPSCCRLRPAPLLSNMDWQRGRQQQHFTGLSARLPDHAALRFSPLVLPPEPFACFLVCLVCFRVVFLL